MAKRLGVTPGAVGGKLWLEGKKKAAEPEETNREAYWRKKAEEAERKLANRDVEATATEILVERIMEIAPTSYSPAPKVIVPERNPGGSPHSVVLMLSDTHVGQCVDPDQTLGLGNYSFDVFLRRLQRLEDATRSILNDHTTTPIREIVVAMIGDMMHGNLNHAAEAGQLNTAFNQFYSAGHAIAQFLRNISTLAPIRVVTAVGNHTRWGTQRKMPTDNRYSNLDQFLYAYLQALVRDIPSIDFKLDKQPFALFEVENHVFYAGHGDHLRGGDYILGVPNHAIGRNLSSTVQNFSAANMKVPHYYLVGHLHKPITLSHTHGEFIVNGGFPGMDGYGLMEGFKGIRPSQRLFLMHPKFGKSASYNIRLDFGDKVPHRYTLPGEFTCK